MSGNAVVLLDTQLKEREENRIGAPLADDDAFELFSFEQALREQDLTEDDIAAGQVGGGNDGGIDGLYCFLRGFLLDEDAEVLSDTFDPTTVGREPELLLVVVQAKRSASFAETTFDKLAATLGELLDLGKTDEDLAELFSPKLIERIGIFRKAWTKLASRHPRVRVVFYYVTKGDARQINDKVRAKADRLREQVSDAIPKAETDVHFYGARELVDLAGQEKSYTLTLTYRENATASESHIALVTLEDYYNFISDKGVLRKHNFDWNVRDYQGGVEVNREIAGSLGDPNAPEFWWLNNGVTVICSAVSVTGKTFSLDDVQIVNGLQTSVTIHEYLRNADAEDPARERSLLVRIIVTADHGTRDGVIRATNRQTAVGDASLRATDQVQRDLEQLFLSEDWFYERRKNHYRNQGKSPSKIVTIPSLAQAIMAIGLSEPSNSRARPSSLLKRDSDYTRVFDPRVEYRTYLWIAQVQKAVDDFLRTERAAAPASDRTNLRFHVSMLLVAKEFGSRVYNPSQLKDLVGTVFTEDKMMEALEQVREVLGKYQEDHGGEVDRIVKGRSFTEAVLERAFPTSDAGSGTE
jgi:hypothetical protein